MEDSVKTMEAYSRLFTSADGQVVLDDLEISYGRRCSFVPGDSHYTAFREGERSTLLKIRDMLARVEELRRPESKKRPDNYMGEENG